MRRQLTLAGLWPLLAHYFGIHPWDIYRLTFDEINGYIDALPKKSTKG